MDDMESSRAVGIVQCSTMYTRKVLLLFWEVRNSFSDSPKSELCGISKLLSSKKLYKIRNGHYPFAKRLLAEVKPEVSRSKCRYLGLCFTVPTSNLCERMFSSAGYTFSDRRKSVLLSNFKTQLFLYANFSFLGLEEVHDDME